MQCSCQFAVVERRDGFDQVGRCGIYDPYGQTDLCVCVCVYVCVR